MNETAEIPFHLLPFSITICLIYSTLSEVSTEESCLLLPLLILTATVFVHIFNKSKLLLSSQEFEAKKCYTHLAEKEEIKPLSFV